jgi:hypothetical protein
MSEVFVNGIAGDVTLDIPASLGEGTIRLRPEGGDDVSLYVTGRLTLEGPWVHVTDDEGRKRSFPSTVVASIAWTERKVL